MKKSRLIVLLVFIIIGIKLYNVYAPNYEIKVDKHNYSYQYLVRIKDSPDEKRTLHIYMNKENKNSETGYLEVLLLPNKIIFWEEVKSKELANVVVNGTLMDYWVDCEWIDDENIQINGIIVDINK